MSLSEFEVVAANDRAAVDRFHGGDWTAFDELYERYRGRLLRYCQYRLRDVHEAEDVAQEAFARAWRSMPTFGGDRNFYPWLRVIAANLCTDTLRLRARSEPAAEIDPGVMQEADRLEEEEDRLLVRQALARLNARHQSALLMREEEGLAYDEIAARTGVSTATVESLLWRARQAFRREFTVLSAADACLAILIVPLALAGRLRAMVKATVARLHQRVTLAGFFSSDVAGFHAAALATAGVAVATIVAAAIGLGGDGPNGPALPPGVVAPGHSAAVATVVPSIAAPSAAPAPPATPAAPATSVPAGVPAVTGTVPPAVSPILDASPIGVPAMVVNPVSTGQASAQEARQDPISLAAGAVALGADPASVARYVQSSATQVAAPVAAAGHSVCVPAVSKC